MDAYIDLSMVLEFALTINNLYFVSTLQKKKFLIRYYILLSILNSFFVYAYHLSLIINVIIKCVSIFLFLILIKRKNKFTSLFLYLFSDTSFRLVLPLLFKDISFFKYTLIVNNSKGILGILFIPFFSLMLFLSTKFTDSIYRLSDYKTTCIIEYLKHKVYVSAYFDTGNTLKYEDIPVVFASISNFPFEIENYVEIEVEGIEGRKIMRACPCLITIEDKKDATFIYLALSEYHSSFHGCEVLLNAYIK